MSQYLSAMMAGVLLVVSCGSLAGGPAVSGMNGKLEAIGGDVDSNGASALAGSLAFPVTEHYGVQVDTAFGEIGGSHLEGIGAHVFWRDPERYLLGAIWSHAEYSSQAMNRLGIEGEYYSGNWTLAGSVGHQWGNVDSAGFGSVDARYYFTSNTMVEAGLSVADSDDRFHIGLESTPFDDWKNLGLFVDLSTGNDSYDHVLVGVRYYFGGKKNLIKRHREDDPINNIFYGVTGAFGEYGDASCSANERWDGSRCVRQHTSGGMTQIDPPS